MRTKALLCAASLLAAGVATSMAQSNVYSLNVVGYVNVVITNGLNLIANPLNNTAANGNTISNLFNSLDRNSGAGSVQYTIQQFTGGGYNSYDLDTFGSGWDAGNADSIVLAPGQGFFFKNASGASFTNTFVGDVLQGNLSVPITGNPFRLYLVSSKVPQAADTATLGLTPTAGPGVQSTLQLWNGGGYDVLDYDEFGLVWVGGTAHSMPNPALGPVIGVAEGFFYKAGTADASTFTRNFTVQ